MHVTFSGGGLSDETSDKRDLSFHLVNEISLTIIMIIIITNVH